MSMILRTCAAALWLALAALRAQAADAPSSFKHITIDGSFEDWAGVSPAYEDASDTDEAADYKTIYVAHDQDFLYIRFTLYKPHAQFTSHENIFLDADNDPSTGLSVFIGSEMLIQGGNGYQERDGGFNEGAITGLDWQAAPTGLAADFELRISRKAVFASDSTPVFGSDTIAFVLEAEDANFSRKETAPDSEGVVYTFTAAPPALTGSTNLITLANSSWRYLTPAAAPAPDWKDHDFNDSSWASGKGAFGFTTDAAAWGATINSPLPNGTKTAYLRTRFSWDKDAAGAVLAVSTFLSDGAVLYLNGAEVRRVRMPSGLIGFDTPATGGPDSRAQAQVFGLPPGALINGENVLAVEIHDGNGAPGELLFDLGLQAAISFGVVLTDPAQPADRQVVAGQSTTFTAEVLGTPPLSFQWLKDGQPIAGATAPTFTLGSVLPGDAGKYSVGVTNPAGSVTSRSAVLTVSGAPIVITNPDQPADVTTTEGLSVTFNVVVSGSAPLSYQWSKGVTPIVGATNASFTLTNVSPVAAGDYSVKVTNPVNSVSSRTAKLVVNPDSAPPTLTSVVGTPDQILIVFSEPVDEATATVRGNYTLGGGLTVQGATVSPDDAASVTLATSAQKLGTEYTVSVAGVKDRFGNTIAANASRSFRSTVVIDGSFADWAGLEIAHTDAQEDPVAGTDFKDVWVFSDANYLYLHFTLYKPGNPNTYLNNIFIDADNDPATGFSSSGIGSEMLIQEGAGYQEKNGGFNEGGISDLDFAVFPAGEGTEFELRISRNAKYASDGLKVFTNDTIRFFLETENSSFSTTDTAPDSAGIEYTLAAGPAPAPGSLGITLQDGKITISWNGAGQLQSRPSLTAGTWQDVPNATSPYAVTPAPGQAFYRLISVP
jgi:hypothetical protein